MKTYEPHRHMNIRTYVNVRKHTQRNPMKKETFTETLMNEIKAQSGKTLKNFPHKDLPIISFKSKESVDRYARKCPAWVAPGGKFEHTNFFMAIENYKHRPRIVEAEVSPCYVRDTDTIFMPSVEPFYGKHSYYGVLFHELIHSTGLSNRLSRNSLTRPENPVVFTRPSNDHAYEQIVAESGAAYVVNTLAKLTSYRALYVARYISSYAKLVSMPETILRESLADARAAASYVLNGITVPE